MRKKRKYTPRKTVSTDGPSLHEQEINKLIKVAELRADNRAQRLEDKSKNVPDGKGGYFNWCFRSQFFHEEMNKLTSEAGLRII